MHYVRMVSPDSWKGIDVQMKRDGATGHNVIIACRHPGAAMVHLDDCDPIELDSYQLTADHPWRMVCIVIKAILTAISGVIQVEAEWNMMQMEKKS